MKTCSKCNKQKEITLFYKDSTKPDGHRPDCKECCKKSVNLDRRRAYEAEYRAANLERRRAIVRKSCEKNKEKYSDVRREYLKTDRGIAMYRKQTQKRYALRKSAYVEDVNPIELYHEQDGVCYLCGNIFDFKNMELDHVYPIARGGLHEKSNCKMACKKCNRSKGSKTLEEMIYPVV